MSTNAPERVPLGKPYLDEREEEATLRVLRSGRLAMGPEVAQFEEELAAYCGRRFAGFGAYRVPVGTEKPKLILEILI